MAMNSHNNYADRKNGRQEIEPIHPELAEPLREILAETHGLVVYQEQIMQIAQRVAGFSMGRADILRRAMGKKKKDVLEKEFSGFRAGMLDSGFSYEAVQALWDTILPFAGYAFNKSHAAGYALVGYWTAYLKAHHPAEYMAGLLTSVGDNKDKSAVYLSECRRLGIRVLPPDANESALRFTAVGDDIRFGLGAIRNLGAPVVESMIHTRTEHGKYTSFADFLDKSDLVVCNKRVVQSLVKAGAFDSLGQTRKAMVGVHEEAVDAVVQLKRQQAMGQFDLFDADSQSSPLVGLTFTTEEYPQKELLAYERDMLGLYVSAHPLDGAQALLRQHARKPIASILADSPAHGDLAVAGLITAVERRVNKKGEPWAICTIEDLDASVEILFFPRTYTVVSPDLVEDNVVVVKGRVNWRDDRLSIFGDEVVPLDTSAPESPLVLRAAAETVSPAVVDELRQALMAHRGSTPVRVRLVHGGEERLFALPDYPVTVTPMLLSELKAIPGISVQPG
jgi:DNA polymerase-3 subunit alpha